MTQYIVMIGNVVDGLTLVGPFKDHDAALEYARVFDCDWLIAPVQAPTEED